MAQIFISYSRADRNFIEQFVPLIRRVYGNDSLWFDEDIHGGADWWQTILEEIRRCDLFIYLISNESLESPYCQAELREALRLNKKILPVIVRRLKNYPGDIEPDLAAVLRKTQYVDMSGGFKNEANNVRLWGAIHKLLDATPQQSPSISGTIPTPEPPVLDKKKRDSNITAAYIAGGFALFAAIIAGVFGLWQGAFADNNDAPPTTAIVQEQTDTPTGEPTEPTSDTASPTRASENEETVATADAQTNIHRMTADADATLVAHATENAVATRHYAGATNTADRSVTTDTPTRGTQPNISNETGNIEVPTTVAVTNNFDPITPDNFEVGYAIRGWCRGFSPDGTLAVISRNGLYDIRTGMEVIDIQGWEVYFSDDGSQIYVSDDGVYDLESGTLLHRVNGQVSPNGQTYIREDGAVVETITGQVKFNLPTDNLGWAQYSPTGDYIGLSTRGVYDVSSGEIVVSFIDQASNESTVFSINDQYVAVAYDGVYELNTGIRLIDLNNYMDIAIPARRPTFDNSSKYLAITNVGIFELTSAHRIFEHVQTNATTNIAFDPHSIYFAVADQGVYELSGDIIIETDIGSDEPVFSSSGQYVSFANDGTYSISSRRKFSDIRLSYFNNNDGIAMTHTWGACLISGAGTNEWPYRSGLVQSTTGRTNIRERPDLNSTVLQSSSRYLSVVATTPDKSWFKVIHDDTYGWVSAAAVDVLSLSDEIPIEDP